MDYTKQDSEKGFLNRIRNRIFYLKKIETYYVQ